MRILGIETSCDETGIGVVEDGRRVLSNVIGSQVELHARYGGVVPEVASRQHILAAVPILGQALEQAGTALEQIEAVAVTMGPGLAGSLLVGLNFAKGLAFGLGLPLVGVNHLEGHIYAAWLGEGPDPAQEPGFPLLCLITSGGHTDLVLMQGHGQYALLGRTRDDAAGEAFDKAARVLGLSFPGGPEIQRVAQGVQATEKLPRAWLQDSLDFSFSGVKTALLHRAQARGLYPARPGETVTPDPAAVAGLAASFQESVVEVMVTKAVEAAQRHRCRGILLGGGVAANALLRQQMKKHSPVPVLIPRPILCTDNGAMIAACAYYRFQQGERHTIDLDIYPSLRLG
ncbi:MAG: tRNA (adenosine(37)-N6)-threonylcarbamoyltransferase complex transferase subunit TsaD [Chloroflexi bacterium]|nr:tRNA (adenosine(37)-N6)-threonylcarbamoyltransferase complex transferase subunit TsaD [Chloroflexota bacterium]